MTVVAKVGKALGTHQSFAFKVNSRPDQPDDNLAINNRILYAK